MSRFRDQAIEEWDRMFPREKIEAIDPENERDLLLEYINWLNDFAEKIHPAKEPVRHPLDFLDELGETWIELRTETLEEDRQDEYEPEEERG